MLANNGWVYFQKYLAVKAPQAGGALIFRRQIPHDYHAQNSSNPPMLALGPPEY